MTVKPLDYRGDGTYYLDDPAHELDDLRVGPPGRVLAGEGSLRDVLADVLAGSGSGPALDLVIAAPKPVSVLLALEDAPIARRVVELHERAVCDALRYLAHETPLHAAPVVAFTHGINRSMDPHLHTHVLVGPRAHDGTPVDTSAVPAHARAADALYLGVLRHGLPASCGRRAWCSPRDTVLVEGVDAGIVASATAPKELDGRVERSALKSHPAATTVHRHWARLVQVGPIGLVARPPSITGNVDEVRLTRALGRGSVRHRDVVAAWATACTFGEPTASVLGAAELLAPGLSGPERRPVAEVADPDGVRVLGPRPLGRDALTRWLDGRRALDRYLAGGHGVHHVVDPRGAPARTRLALAELDVALGPVGRMRTTREVDMGRSLT